MSQNRKDKEHDVHLNKRTDGKGYRSVLGQLSGLCKILRAITITRKMHK